MNTAIGDETIRALAAEGVLNTAIDDETLRALMAESDLNTALTALIGDETTRAMAAEAALAAAIAAIVPGGSGGGATLIFSNGGDAAAISSVEFNQPVYLFSFGAYQKIYGTLKVPESYLAGKQIKLVCYSYSPSTINSYQFLAISNLIRTGIDPVGSVLNSHTSINPAISNIGPNVLKKIILDITDGTGKINAVAVTAGDDIELYVVRSVDTDMADIRIRALAVEITF